MAIQLTGISLIDRTVGGLSPGLPCVIAGPSGSGRTVIALELAASALADGQKVAFLCNEPPALVLQQASTLRIDLETPIEEERLLLLELDAGVAGTVRSAGLRPLLDALAREAADVDQLIIDPFTVLTSEVLDEPALREHAREFMTAASAIKLVLTLESERLALQQGLERVLSEVCGSFVHLERDRQGGRELVVAKSRAGVGGLERLRFEIASSGITLLESATATAAAAPRASGEADASLTPSERTPASPHARASVAPGAASLAADPESKERKVILLVDPEMESRREIASWLEDRYEIVTASDGFEAMTTLLTHRPDIVVLDLIMPRVSGYELLPAFRRGAQTIPLLVLSSRMSRPADRLAPLILGATDVLAKPVERFELTHKIEILASLAGSATPQLMDPAEAEALFGSVSNSRILEEHEFRSRLARAVDFGARFGQVSTVVAIEGPTTAYIDAFVASADTGLRFEDAIVRVAKKRALMLLIASAQEQSELVAERLFEQFRSQKRRAGTVRIRHWIADVSHGSADFDWAELFCGLEPMESEEPGEKAMEKST